MFGHVVNEKWKWERNPQNAIASRQNKNGSETGANHFPRNNPSNWSAYMFNVHITTLFEHMYSFSIALRCCWRFFSLSLSRFLIAIGLWHRLWWTCLLMRFIDIDIIPNPLYNTKSLLCSLFPLIYILLIIIAIAQYQKHLCNLQTHIL